MYNGGIKNIKSKTTVKMKSNKTIKTKSKKPYLLEIKKFKKNEKLLGDPSLLEYTLEVSPLSKSEPEYNPKIWNDNEKTKESHNCYSYALGKIVNKLDSKAQPGYASGFDYIEDDNYKCDIFYERLKKDVPGAYLEKFDNKCLPGFYKIFLALDVENDYHWWRQDNTQYWSHKPGTTEVTDIDASGKKILNPLLANRDYGQLNYNKPCFFACIYSDLSRSLDSIYNI